MKTNEKVYNVIVTKQFESDVKYYVRKKKFRHIVDDIESVTSELEKGNLLGDAIPELSFHDNEHTIKVRAANTDTKSGKSDGYRIIYYVIKDDKEIYLLTIYYKKDDNRIPTNKEIEGLVKRYCLSEEKPPEEQPTEEK
jgi:mRNA-degrading endonuclease RelE of RelBE toxin-antitoxin system